MATISIILPTYNGARHIRQSINSCLAQSYGNLEVIVVDGGSQDGTVDLVEKYTDPRVRLIHQENNTGRLPGALNLGMAQATGDYLTWTHDDNWYAPQAIGVMTRTLESNPDTAFVYCDYWKVNADGHTLSRFRALPPKHLDEGNCVGHCFLYRRLVRDIIGEYDPEFFLAEDYEYWLRVRRSFQMSCLSEALYYYRVHETSLTESRGLEAVFRSAERARRKWLGLDPYRFPSWFARAVGQAYLDRAFEAHRSGQWRACRFYLFRALRHDLRHLGNRGVRSLLARAIGQYLTSREVGPA